MTTRTKRRATNQPAAAQEPTYPPPKKLPTPDVLHWFHVGNTWLYRQRKKGAVHAEPLPTVAGHENKSGRREQLHDVDDLIQLTGKHPNITALTATACVVYCRDVLGVEIDARQIQQSRSIRPNADGLIPIGDLFRFAAPIVAKNGRVVIDGKPYYVISKAAAAADCSIKTLETWLPRRPGDRINLCKFLGRALDAREEWVRVPVARHEKHALQKQMPVKLVPRYLWVIAEDDVQAIKRAKADPRNADDDKPRGLSHRELSQAPYNWPAGTIHRYLSESCPYRDDSQPIDTRDEVREVAPGRVQSIRVADRTQCDEVDAKMKAAAAGQGDNIELWKVSNETGIDRATLKYLSRHACVELGFRLSIVSHYGRARGDAPRGKFRRKMDHIPRAQYKWLKREADKDPPPNSLTIVSLAKRLGKSRRDVCRAIAGLNVERVYLAQCVRWSDVPAIARRLGVPAPQSPAADANAGTPEQPETAATAGDAQRRAATGRDPEALYPPADLCEELPALSKKSPDARRQWLRRFRRDHPHDFEQVADADGRQAQFRYRLSAVRDAL